MLEHRLFDAYLLKHGFDHQVGAAKRLVAQGGLEQGHALLVLIGLELAFLDLRLVVLADRGNTPVQRFLLHLQHHDRQASVQKIHGDAPAHGARTNHRHRLDRPLPCVGRNIRDLGGSTLGHENVAQRTRLSGLHQADEDVSLGGHADLKLLPRGSFDCIHALGRRREILGHALDHVAGKLEVSVALGVLAGQVAHQGERPHGGNGARKSQGLLCQGIDRPRHLVKQFLAGKHGQHFALDGLAAHNHVEGDFNPQHTRQALRAARSGDQTQLDLGQSHAATGRCDAVMAAQRELQATAHHHRMNRSHHWLAGLLQHGNHTAQVGLLHGTGAAELFDVGAAGKRLARAGNDNGCNGRVSTGLRQPLGNALPGGQAQTIDGWVAQSDYGDVALRAVVGSHGGFLQEANRTSVLFRIVFLGAPSLRQFCHGRD